MAGIGAVGATAIGVIAAGAEIDGLDAIATVDGVVVALPVYVTVFTPAPRVTTLDGPVPRVALSLPFPSVMALEPFPASTTSLPLPSVMTLSRPPPRCSRCR